MKVLVCGSRSWSWPTLIGKRLARLEADSLVIHGGADGADTYANIYAQGLGLKQHVYPADWETHGKRAGIMRNLQMLDQQPDLVLAFWDGQSKGTKHTITEAKRRGISVEVIEP